MPETAVQQLHPAPAAPLYSLRAVEKRYGEGATQVVAVAPTDLEIAGGEYVGDRRAERVGQDDAAAAARRARPARAPARSRFEGKPARADGRRRAGAAAARHASASSSSSST